MTEPTTKFPIPADIHAEAKLLGAMLYDARHVSALTPKLTEEKFFSEAHRQIFSAIADLRDRRVDVNRTTVETLLRKRERLSQLEEGGSYLDKLIDAVPVLTPSTFETLASVVLDRATQREALLVLQRAVARLSRPGLEDVSGALSDVEKEVIGVSLQTHDSGGLRPIREALRAEVTEWKDQAEGKGTPGIPTGFTAYDSVTGGLHRGDLVIVAARPGMGKTSFVTSACVNIAKRGETAGIFSLEMPARQLAGRMLCTEAGIAFSATRRGQISPKGFTNIQVALSEMATLGIYVDDASKGRPYVADIVSRSRRLAADAARRGKRLGLIVVDYLQIVRLREALVKQRHDLAVGEVSTELKQLAKELDTTVIGVAQLNRGVEQRADKRPMMSDLRDSGQLEQDADAIVMLYRDEYYNPKTDRPGLVEISFEKNRHGPTVRNVMRFDGPTTKFYDLAPSEEGLYE